MLNEVTWWYWLTDGLVWRSEMASLCVSGSLAGRLGLAGTTTRSACWWLLLWSKGVILFHGDWMLQEWVFQDTPVEQSRLVSLRSPRYGCHVLIVKQVTQDRPYAGRGELRVCLWEALETCCLLYLPQCNSYLSVVSACSDTYWHKPCVSFVRPCCRILLVAHTDQLDSF